MAGARRTANPLARSPRELMITLLMLIYVLCRFVRRTMAHFCSVRLPTVRWQINIYRSVWLSLVLCKKRDAQWITGHLAQIALSQWVLSEKGLLNNL
ncbi:hypothetical protein EVAR_79967_1 [Eumeta japonica]|uniref:Uncharacterized protein n=1 Tax=Eumeta variegata TaxID=151549 RepID=A0A4C1Y4H6_EUMVA|nr:hypothetical protein EVAR_79967_1 [Eumeta japonica]